MSAALEERLRRLEDIEAIKQLKARYCQACDDDHNPDRVAALFVEDGLWEGPNIGVHARGRPAIRAYFAGVRDDAGIRNSAHIVTNPVITVSGDRATGTWRLVMLHTSAAPGGGFRYHRIVGFYQDDYARVQDAWFLERLRVTVEEAGVYAVARHARQGGSLSPMRS